jgi:hypothetical protein
MAGTITVGELLSDPSSNNKITIGTGTTLDLVSGAGSVSMPAGSLTGALPALDGSALTGAGKVLQVVQVVYSTASQTGSSYLVDTGLSASITPSSTSSKILVMVAQPLAISSATDTARDVTFNIVRGGTEIIKGTAEIDLPGTSSFMKIAAANCLNYLDSPNTTVSATYKTQFRVNSGTSDVYANQHGGSSTITLMEIGA